MEAQPGDKEMTSNTGPLACSVTASDQMKKFKKKLISRDWNGIAASGPTHAREDTLSSISPGSVRDPQIETLTSLSVSVIAKNFEKKPVSSDIPKKLLPELTAKLPLDLDISVASAYVNDERYWKARSESRSWKNCQISEHGNTWKQLYMELSLQEVLEDYDPDKDNFQRIADWIKASEVCMEKA